ncbi:MotA/TolQ/ExbB proton channel family protein [Myxococcota bacterium]|nr:MotA/TolQ/ExbB proton channel family protein [Myxococcota bacterium]
MALLFVGAAMGGRLASLDVLSLVLQAGWIVQVVLGILALASIGSWTIITFKWRELRRAQQDSEAFVEIYQQGSFDGAYDAARDLEASPVAAVFLDVHVEWTRLSRSGPPSPGQARALIGRIAWTSAREIQRLEKGLSILATTGNAAPFIGLFGTVIGIIDAFQGIGRTGSASLAVVAPGISEALIATAVGLFAAIPATIFYNYFVGELRELTSSVDLFRAEYEGDLQRALDASEQVKQSRSPGPT